MERLNVILDVRGQPKEGINRLLAGQEESTSIFVAAYQTQWLDPDVAEAGNFVAIVPDIVRYDRILAEGRLGDFLNLGSTRLESARALLLAGTHSLKSTLSLARQDYWAVARALLMYDLSMLSGWYKGGIVLHSRLTDLALALQKRDLLEDWLGLRRATVDGCRRGFWTEQLPLALSLLSQWNLRPQVLVHSQSPGDEGTRLAASAAAEDPVFQGTELLSTGLRTC